MGAWFGLMSLADVLNGAGCDGDHCIETLLVGLPIVTILCAVFSIWMWKKGDALLRKKQEPKA